MLEVPARFANATLEIVRGIAIVPQSVGNFSRVAPVYPSMLRFAQLACGFLGVVIVTSASAQPRRLAISYVVAHFKELNGSCIEIEGRGSPSSIYLLPDGIIQTSGPACTLLMCGDDAACNSCGSDLSIVDSNSGAGIALKGVFQGKAIQCAGNEALMTCNPPKMQRIRVAGILRVEDDHGGPIRLVLEVRSLVPLPDGP